MLLVQWTASQPVSTNEKKPTHLNTVNQIGSNPIPAKTVDHHVAEAENPDYDELFQLLLQLYNMYYQKQAQHQPKVSSTTTRRSNFWRKRSNFW
jgi:hypothetical protein